MSKIDDYDVVSSATGWDRVFVRKRDGTEGVGFLKFCCGAFFCWICTHGLYLYIGAGTPLAKIALLGTGIISFIVGVCVTLWLGVILAVLVLAVMVAAVIYGVGIWIIS